MTHSAAISRAAAADRRADDEFLLLRLLLKLDGRADVVLPVIRDKVASAMTTEFLADPDAPDIDIVRQAAARSGVSEAEISAALRDRCVDQPLVFRNPADALRRLADRLRRDDARNAATVELEQAIDERKREGGAVRLAEAAARVAAVELGGGDGPAALPTLADAFVDPSLCPLERVRTGVKFFDDALEGGMPRGTVTALLAAPKVGKSALSLQLVLSFLRCNPGSRAVNFLGEMSRRTLQVRSLAQLSGLSPIMLERPVDSLSERDGGLRTVGLQRFHEIAPRLVVLDGQQTPGSLLRAAKDTGSELLVVDYLQLLRCGDGAADKFSRREQLEAMSRELCSGAASTGLAVLLVAATANGNTRAGAEVDICGAFRESGAVGFDVDAAYFGSVDREVTQALGDVAKKAVTWKCLGNRNGLALDMRTVLDSPTLKYMALEGRRDG